MYSLIHIKFFLLSVCPFVQNVLPVLIIYIFVIRFRGKNSLRYADITKKTKNYHELLKSAVNTNFTSLININIQYINIYKIEPLEAFEILISTVLLRWNRTTPSYLVQINFNLCYSACNKCPPLGPIHLRSSLVRRPFYRTFPSFCCRF